MGFFPVLQEVFSKLKKILPLEFMENNLSEK